MLMKCDPSQLPMRIEGMSLGEGMTTVRLAERFDLLGQFDAHFHAGAHSAAVGELSHMHQKAFDLLHSDASRAAFQLERESPARDHRQRHAAAGVGWCVRSGAFNKVTPAR